MPRGIPPAPAAAPARGVGAAGGAALHAALAAQLRHRHALLPARLLHDEVQPAGLQFARDAAGLPRPASARAGLDRAGRAGLPVRAAGDAEARDRHGGRLADADGRRPGRVRRRRDDPRLPPRARRPRAQRDHRPGRGARHQPGDRDDVRHEGARDPDACRRRRRPRGARGRAVARDRRHHADQPEHARRVRAAHRRDRAQGARGGRAALLRRREPERDPRQGAPRGHGIRRDPHEPAQDVLDAARRRRPGLRRGRRRAAPAAVHAGAGRRARGRPLPLARRARPAGLDRAAVGLHGQHRRAAAGLGLHAHPRRRRHAPRRRVLDAERQLPAGAAARRRASRRPTRAGARATSSS